MWANDSGALQDHISISIDCLSYTPYSQPHIQTTRPPMSYLPNHPPNLQPPLILYNCDLCHNCPPSTGTVAPFTCPLALLAKNTTNPAISSGLPNLPVGFLLANASGPPMASINPFAMRVGKKPGAMELQRMCLGPSSMARWFIRWITAALEAE